MSRSILIPIASRFSFLPGVLVLLFMSPVKLLMVATLLIVYQQIKDNLIAPRVMGRVVGLHPVIVHDAANRRAGGYFCPVNGTENAVFSHIILKTPPAPDGSLETSIAN